MAPDLSPMPRPVPDGRAVTAASRGDDVGPQVPPIPSALTVASTPSADSGGPGSIRRRMSEAEAQARLAPLARRNWHPSFQIVLPIDGEIASGSPAWKTLDSLSRQAYADWTLQLVNCAGSDLPMAMSQIPQVLMESFGDITDRVTLRRKGSRETVNFGLGAARARPPVELVLVLRAGDELGCDALLEFALASAMEPEADFLYSDDRRPTPTDERLAAFCKPDWSPDLLLGWNYIGRSWCANRSLFRRAGVHPRGLVDHNDHDLVLRLTEVATRVVHVPRVLSQVGLEWSQGVASEIETLEQAMQRRGLEGEILLGRWPGQYRIRRQLVEPGLVSIIVPTRAAGGHIVTCIESLRRFTAYRHYEIICIENIPAGHSECRGWLYKNANQVINASGAFNCARFNNLAAARAHGEYLLFLHDVVKVVDAGWLEALLEHAQRPEVGVVGPQLLYPDCSVQHAGLLLDDEGRRRHAFHLQPADDAGYFGLALSERNVIGVAGACQLMRREVFERLGGFDEDDSVGNYDLDLCLRAHTAGLRNVYTPHASLIHFEIDSSVRIEERSASPAFRERWGRLIAAGDPYFNPNLSCDQDSFCVGPEPMVIAYPARPLFARGAVHRILVIKLDDVGDAVAALPAVRRLKKHFPQARISVLAGCATYSIWKMEPAADEILEFNLDETPRGAGGRVVNPEDLKALLDLLGSRRFDLALDLGQRPETRGVLRYSGARWLAGYDDHGRFPWLDVAAPRADAGKSRNNIASTETLVALVDEVAAASGPAAADRHQAPLNLPAGMQKALFNKPLVCIHAASGSPAKPAALDGCAQLIDLLLAGADVNVALIGSAEDRESAGRLLNRDDGVAGLRGRLFDLIGCIGPPDIPALVARAALFIGGDGSTVPRVGTLGRTAPLHVPSWWMLRSGRRRDLGAFTGRLDTAVASP